MLYNRKKERSEHGGLGFIDVEYVNECLKNIYIQNEIGIKEIMSGRYAIGTLQ